MTGFCKKRRILCTKNKLGFPEIAIFVYVQFFMRRSLIGSEVRFWWRVFFEALWLVNVKKDARMVEYGKKHFSESKPGAKWAKLWVKSIQTLFEFVEKLVNLDEKVIIWSFLTLIAKNKLDEKGILNLISKGVPFLMNARIGLILVLEGTVFHYIWLKCLFRTVTTDSDIFF